MNKTTAVAYRARARLSAAFQASPRFLRAALGADEGSMPRRGQYGLNVVSLPAQRLVPPPELNEAEREVFTAVVGATDPKHFRESDLPLLVSYVAAVVTEREALDHLRREGWVTAAGRPSGWVVIKEKSHREMISLSLRLRLSPQGRSRVTPKPARVSAYEKLELEERNDDD
jgi:hypothetical protein